MTGTDDATRTRTSDAAGSRRALPSTERVDPPRYLATYLDRQRARSGTLTTEPDSITEPDVTTDHATSTPLYLRRFRERRSSPRSGPHALPPLHERAGLGVQRALSEDNRTKEISAPPHARKAVVADVYLIRHGETQGYSTESGLTPLGTWQAHTYGHTVAKRVSHGENVVIRHADTSRAEETAQGLDRGLQDGL
ncbi:MAG: histidine phosphatase family protein, partial [Phycicoccus sp.]